MRPWPALCFVGMMRLRDLWFLLCAGEGGGTTRLGKQNFGGRRGAGPAGGGISYGWDIELEYVSGLFR
jgi:hypothetical protein